MPASKDERSISFRGMKKISVLFLVMLFIGVSGCQDSRTAEQIYQSGIDNAIRGEFKRAEKEFKKVLEVNSLHKQSRESLKIIEGVLLKTIKDRAVIYFFKAISRSNSRRFDEAVSFFSMAIKQSPEFVQAYYERGLVNAYQGRYVFAINDFTRTVELNPDDVIAYNNRGLAYAKGKKQFDHAMADFNRAIELDPEFAEAYDNRGIAHRMKSDDKEKACADWKKACDLKRCRSYELAKQNGYCK